MSEYTPTTDQVRDIWADYPATLPGLQQLGEVSLYVAREQAFDRWHADEIRKAKAEAWESCAAVTEDILTDITGDTEPYEGQFSNPYRGGETND